MQFLPLPLVRPAPIGRLYSLSLTNPSEAQKMRNTHLTQPGNHDPPSACRAYETHVWRAATPPGVLTDASGSTRSPVRTTGKDGNIAASPPVRAAGRRPASRAFNRR